jgi:endonuclease/exonuclease/phosphatase family metal-dependent hydrolase
MLERMGERMGKPLHLLTWNIWMMPPIVNESPRNGPRAEAIAAELGARHDTILCLEKAFDGGARDVIGERLKDQFPYRYGPINRVKLDLTLNGGVWVLSRIPLTPVCEIEFRDASGIERLSRKGALLLRGEWEHRPFQLIATHLQGEEGPGYVNQPVRDKQIAQIAHDLIAAHADPALPLFICGDFNTERRDRIDPFAQSPSYLRMLQLFGAVNGEEERVTLDDKRVHNDLANYDTGRVAELDYILLRRAGQAIQGTWRQVVLRRQGWDGPEGRRDLSYRFAVSACFAWSD